MTRLSNVRLLDINRYLLDLYAAMSVEKLRQIIPEGASRLIASDRANFNEFDTAVGRQYILPSPVPAYWARLGPVILAHMEEHPLASRHCAAPQHAPRTFSDFRDIPEWKYSTLYHEYHLPAGTRYQLFVHLCTIGTVRCSLAFNRQIRDFSAADRAVLELLGPHIASAWQNAIEFSSWQKKGVFETQSSPAPAVRSTRQFTPREREILHWLAEGKRNIEIGQILEMSPRTVGKHLEHLYAKLDVDNRTAAVRAAAESVL